MIIIIGLCKHHELQDSINIKIMENFLLVRDYNWLCLSMSSYHVGKH